MEFTPSPERGDHSFSLLEEKNHAFLLSVEERVKSALPLTLRIVESSCALQVRIGERAQATVFVSISSPAEAEISIDVAVGDGASLALILLEESASFPRRITQSARIGASAHLQLLAVTLGANTEHTLQSRVEGVKGKSDIDWIFYARDAERQSLSARNIFGAREGGGEITMKGVAQDRGAVACNGMIEIGLPGAGTNTYLTQNILMLDRTAKVDAIPGLEIKTNDVKASHSATVTRVTEEDLFYFGARGIPEKAARGMFVQGFLGELLGRIADAKIRALVQGQVERKFAGV